MALSDDKIQELKQQYGDRLVAISTPIEMVFKKPSRQVWADFQDSVSKDKGTREMAYRRLCLACVVTPAVNDAVAVFDDYPALPTRLGDALAGLVGMASDDFEIKKL